MSYTVSPGINIVEQDLSQVVNQISSTPGGFVGDFEWGPVLEVTTVANQNDLVNKFGKPNDDNFVSFWSASNFLDYTYNLQLVRTVGSLAKNAVATGTAILIKNKTHYEENFAAGEASVGPVAAKYPGTKGNGLQVHIADSASFSGIALTGDITTLTTSKSVVGVGTFFTTELHVGAVLKNGAGATIGTVASITDDTHLTLETNAIVAVNANVATFNWKYAANFGIAPSTSTYVASRGGSNDELHVVIVDSLGKFTGTIGAILKTYPFLSKASDAKDATGNSSYYANVLLNDSYVFWMDHPTLGTNWGSQSTNTAFTSLVTPSISVLSGGVDSVSADGDKETGWTLFNNTETVNVGLLVTGDASPALQNYVISSIAEVRKDSVAFVSPQRTDVINNSGSEATACVTSRNLLPSSSYAVMDSGWKYQYDRFNDVYRWIPLNADNAGLCARTDNNYQPWYSPAGVSRGQIKNVTKLSWNPSKADRDILYVSGVNPVVTFPRQGTMLYGDKTLQSHSSAFDRINVRRLFIVLEKSISVASQYQLFEFNDVYSQAAFRNLVNPFLREVQGGKGITDFSVICDSTNNTAAIAANNQFRAQVIVKPNYSTNFIELNFTCVNNIAQFNVIGG